MLNPFRIAFRAVGACALTLALLSSAQAAPVLEMSTAHTIDGFRLTVSAKDVEDLYAYQFTLNFDPALLAVLSVTEGPMLSSQGGTFFLPGDVDNRGGSVSFVLGTLIGPDAGVDGSGDLATFLFDVQQSGLAHFSLSDVWLLDSTGAELVADIRDLVTQVPEPATGLLAAFGVLAALNRRRSATPTA